MKRRMTTESKLEADLIAKLSDLKYWYRPDIRSPSRLRPIEN
jgi:hypothetical protein